MVIKTTFTDGVIQYRLLNNRLHREAGPAVIWPDGAQAYYINGLRHREDGPAVIRPTTGYRAYWLNGERFTKQQFDKIQMQKEVEHEWRTS